jgi:mxaA protein
MRGGGAKRAPAAFRGEARCEPATFGCGVVRAPVALSGCIGLVLILMAWRVVAAAPVGHDAVVEQPRAFGHVLGDVITQRVLLEANGRVFTPDELPAGGPAGNWVERRAVRVERDDGGHPWLVVDYQIMNSPQALTAIAIPAWKLASKTRDGELRVPEWSITVAPLTPRQPLARAGLGDLRPDRRAALIDVAPMQRWLATWIGALLVCVAAWVAWWAWRNWQASSAQPFARALREIRGVDESSPEAWYALHRAFDGTAGRVVQPEALSVLFERAPHFEPQRSAIEQFFASSAERFFGVASESASADSDGSAPAVGSSAEPRRTSGDGVKNRRNLGGVSTSALSLRSLCLSLRRLEKRHEP